MTYLQIAIFSLGYGAVYASLANGLVMTFRATGIINFGMGAMAMWGAYVYFHLRTDGRLVLPVFSVDLGSPQGSAVGLLAALLSAALIALLVFYLAFRPVRNAPVLAQVVVSIAVMLTLTALTIIRFTSDPIANFSFGRVGLFRTRTELWHGLPIAVSNLYVAGLIVVLVAAGWAYLRYTRSGVATRAVSGNERAAILMGYAPDRLALVAMLSATLVATVGVIAAASILGLSPTLYSLFVVPALACLLVAKMNSLPIAALAGFAFAVLQQYLVNWSTEGWWPHWAQAGLDQVLPIVVVVIALLVYANRLPARGSLQVMRLPDVQVPSLRPTGGIVTFVGIALALILTHGEWRFGITISLVFAVLSLSYVVITGYVGQMSLAQLAFAGTAGFFLSKMQGWTHVPFFITMLICSLLAMILGVIVAIPALRIRGAQLAIVTMAAALAIERFVFNNNAFIPASGLRVAKPEFFGLDLARQNGDDISRLPFSLMVLVVTAVLIVAFVRVASGRMGRAFLAVRANERAAASAGIDVRMVKIVAFGFSAFLAGAAGCLLGYSVGTISAGSFDTFTGLSMLAVAYLGGITNWGGALLAGALAPLGIFYTIINHFWNTGNEYALVSGLLLILTAILNPTGVAGAIPHQIAWLKRVVGTRQPRPTIVSEGHRG